MSKEGPMDYVKSERLLLKTHPEFSEKWIQDRLAEDPSILGLGDLILKDKERVQPKAGRLDLLFQDPDSGRRYEVEIQLGSLDEKHIIRTIEYWDIERRRFPQYDHCAVIVAEDITSRFLNVISLFNGAIPLVAIQMKALKIEGKIALDFTTVLDELTLGFDEEDYDSEATDRGYWESRGSRHTVALADRMLEMIHSFAPGFELKYKKHYIGLARSGQPSNFVIFKARKKNMTAEVRLKQSDEVQQRLDEANLDLMDYDKRDRRYRIRLKESDVEGNSEFLTQLMKESLDSWDA